MKVKSKSGQSLLDVAIEQYGTWEAAMDLSKANDLTLTSNPNNKVLTLPDKEYDKRMQQFCKNNNVSPATM